ncbi:MAG: siroheme synthase [Hyphomicrobium sp.]
MSGAAGRSTPNSVRPRIGELANLPVFFKLGGKRVVLVGGGEPALWKAELLAATGARVDVFAETFADGFRELASAPPNGAINLVSRRWTLADLENAALAVGSFTDETEAATFASAARAAGVPVNVIDRPAFCDFQFGAIVNRSPLVVGISTDGGAPVFGQAIRSLIEGLLPDSFGQWAAAALNLRRDVDKIGDTPEEKRAFWRRFADLAIRRSARGPTETELAQLRAGEVDAGQSEPVAIIEVNDDADALSLGAIRLLRAADVIFIDDTAPTSVTDFARREARRYRVVGGEVDRLSVTEALARAAASEGRIVWIRHAPRPQSSDDAQALRASGVSVVVFRLGSSA